ncbi:hypothetical protein [Pseudonocardia lacus]|uniref:hypothetical protein n=1 Tax=Pseudonocardia lacus TaxID=2835865 RepID=UPI001BDBC985|nr:hypothetical protein [Pseudonocardia lacus]
MHPNGFARELIELQELAHTLFDVLRERFTVGESLLIRFDRIDSLAEAEIGQEQVVATALLCSQLLHRVTTVPSETDPRHIVTLCDVIDQALINLVEECEWDPAIDVVSRTHRRICDLGMNLAVLADPSAPDFSG